LDVRIVDGRATRELRRAVLRPSWPVDSAMHGDDNPDAVHLATLDDDGRVVAACLVLPRPYPLRAELSDAWQLRGMATAPDLRNQGIGARLLAAAEDEIRRRGGRLVWCDARTTAVPFYRKHGFVAEGEEFLHAESGIPHYRMWRQLA
jgi:predicted GNAT family N-acyltransferase